MDDLRKDCQMRHENGNCTVIGGFCTAVNDAICEGLHSAYDSGYRAAALRAQQEREELLNNRPEGRNPKQIGKEEYNRGCNDCRSDLYELIDDMPAADVALVRHGSIIETIEDGRMKRVFSCCGADFTKMTCWMAPKYCPNCGAKMDGGAD